MSVLLEREESWHPARMIVLEDRVRTRLGSLARHLATDRWLTGSFSAADLLLITVLRRLHGTGLLEEQPCLADYVARGEARPAFQTAFAAQAAVYAAAAHSLHDRFR